MTDTMYRDDNTDTEVGMIEDGNAILAIFNVSSTWHFLLNNNGNILEICEIS